jgi:hypothetical protein
VEVDDRELRRTQRAEGGLDDDAPVDVGLTAPWLVAVGARFLARKVEDLGLSALSTVGLCAAIIGEMDERAGEVSTLVLDTRPGAARHCPEHCVGHKIVSVVATDKQGRDPVEPVGVCVIDSTPGSPIVDARIDVLTVLDHDGVLTKSIHIRLTDPRVLSDDTRWAFLWSTEIWWLIDRLPRLGSQSP